METSAKRVGSLTERQFVGVLIALKPSKSPQKTLKVKPINMHKEEFDSNQGGD